MTYDELHERCTALAEKLRYVTISSEQRPFGVGTGAAINPFVGSRNQLNKAAAGLVSAVGSEAPKDMLLKSIKDLEGYVMIGKTTEVLPDTEADKALGEIQDLHEAIAAL